MSIRIFLTTLFCGFILIPKLYSQNFLVNGGANSFGTAHANVTESTSFSPINNVSGIAAQDEIQIATSAQKYYSQIDIGNLYFTAIYPMKKFSVSAGMVRHGNEFMNQHRVGLGIANKIGFVKLGAQINYLQYQAEGFGSAGAVVLDFGGIAEMTEKLTFGAYVFNFTQSSLKGQEREQLPIIMKAGLSYLLTQKFKVYTELEKEILAEPLFKVGLQYEIIAHLFVRTGITINPTNNFFGLGYHGKKIHFDYGFSYHQTLGMTHQASLGINLKKRD